MRKSIILVILISAFITGCWGRSDVDDIGIVIGLGIDYLPDDKPVLLSAQVINPSAMGSSSNSSKDNPFVIITSQGITFFDAIRNFSESYPRKLIFSHNKLIVIGKIFAERDIKEVIDYIDRDREFRENIWVFTADKSAKEVMQTELSIETLPAMGLAIIMEEHLENAFSIPIKFHDFSNRLKGDIKVGTTPLIKLVDKEKNLKEKLGELGETIEKSKFTKPKEVNIAQTAIFKDKKLIGTIDKNETRGLLWLRDKLKGGTVIISEENDKKVSVFIEEGTTTITPTVKGDQVSMKIECEATARISQVETDLDLLDKKVIDHLEEETEKILTSRVRRVLDMAQNELKTDFVGFGEHLYNQQPEEWERLKDQWEEIFPNVKYEIDFNITITEVGLIKNPD